MAHKREIANPAFFSENATIRASILKARPTHENHLVFLLAKKSAIGAIIKTPPLIKSITKTIETPLKV